MGLVQPWFKQWQDVVQMHQRTQVGTHDLGAVVHPGGRKLYGRSHYAAGDEPPLAREQKHNRCGQSQLRFEDERTDSQTCE